MNQDVGAWGCERRDIVRVFAKDLGYPGIFTIGTVMAASAIVVFLIWGNRSLHHSIGFCLGRDRDVYRLGS